jgi:acyl carrier protein
MREYQARKGSTMSKVASVEGKIKELLIQLLGVDGEEIKPESRIEEDLGADSLDAIELIMAMEEAFDIEIPDDDAAKLRTVQQAVDYIEDQQLKQ